MPVARALTSMRDRQNSQRVSSDSVNHAVGKPLQRESAATIVEAFPDLRQVAQEIHNPLNFIQELSPEAQSASLASSHRSRQFEFGRSMEPGRHFLCEARRRSKTSDAGTESTDPASSSASRRLASSSHAASTPGSEGPSRSSQRARKESLLIGGAKFPNLFLNLLQRPGHNYKLPAAPAACKFASSNPND